MASDRYAVARITGAHGIGGFFRIELLTDDPERLKRLREVYIGLEANEAVPLMVEAVRMLHRSVVIKVKTIDDRTAAEALRNNFIFVAQKDLTKPGRGRWFVHDIIGCAVVTTDGRDVGAVADVMKSAAQDIWVVRSGVKEYLIPAVAEFIAEVDIARRRIVVRPIEGLLDE